MGTCNECGTMLNEEGMCSECNSMKESTKKKKVLRLTESEMFNMIKKMVSESLPGLDVTNRVKKESKKHNEDNAKEVELKIKKATTINGSDNSEFPHQNNGGTKVARQNDEDDDEFVQDNRGGTVLNLDYDTEPSKNFKERLKSALEGDSKMGNSQDAANVVKSDLGKKLASQSDRKKKKVKEAPMYNKDPQPTKVNESTKISSTLINEEIVRMKNMANYNKKTQ
jgi:RNA polymerase subunit RPABC4/transcription elongation factor Spt4